jgi:hypothetical protein
MSLLYFCPKLPGWLGAFVLFHARAKRDFDRPYRCFFRNIYKNPEDLDVLSTLYRSEMPKIRCVKENRNNRGDMQRTPT